MMGFAAYGTQYKTNYISSCYLYSFAAPCLCSLLFGLCSALYYLMERRYTRRGVEVSLPQRHHAICMDTTSFMDGEVWYNLIKCYCYFVML